MTRNRQPGLLLPALFVLLLASCGPAVMNLVPAADNPEPAPAITTIVIEEAGSTPEPQPSTGADEGAVDMAYVVDAVLAYVDDRLSREQEAATAAGTNGGVETGGQSLQAALIKLYERANPGVVYILVPPIGSGSGFIYDEDGHIVTNNHVVEGGQRFEIVFATGERRYAQLVGQDADSDLAVLKVDELSEGLGPLPLGDSEALQVGQFVAAIGNPFGEQGSMSLGIISGLHRSLSSQRQTLTGSSYSLPGVIQTDAPINPGNSGGPLLSLDGAVVGLNAAIASTTGTNSGVGFAIPVNVVRQIVPSLIQSGSYDYPYVGAAFDDEISLDEMSAYGLSQTSGAYVVAVTEDSPAARAGLVAADPVTGRGGDLIVAINDRPVDNFGDLNGYLVLQTTAGQTVNLTVLRGGEQVTLALTLGSRPLQ
jgi:2-alkenal reductase